MNQQQIEFINKVEIKRISELVFKSSVGKNQHEKYDLVRREEGEAPKHEPGDVVIPIENLMECGNALFIADRYEESEFIREIIRRRVRFLIGEDDLASEWFEAYDPRKQASESCGCVSCQTAIAIEKQIEAGAKPN